MGARGVPPPPLRRGGVGLSVEIRGVGGPRPPNTPLKLVICQTKRAQNMLRDQLRESVNDNCRKLLEPAFVT